jgi:putative ABC transport system permease protein
VIRLAIRELISRRVATAMASLGVVTAVLGFVLLAATARTTNAVLTGDVARAWRGPYQLLVRPANARTELEERDGLIRPNYFSGLVGGITAEQYRSIRDLPDVDVAAPVALVGFVEWPASWTLDLRDAVPAGTSGVFRLSFSALGESGLSTYPLGDQFLIAAPNGQLQITPTGTTLRIGESVIGCTQQVRCLVGTTLAPPVPQAVTPATTLAFSLPIVVAGVDPDAEAALAGLSACVSSGRYLLESDVPLQVTSTVGPQTAIPILVSTTSFIDESVRVTIARAVDPAPLLQGTLPQQLRDWENIDQRNVSADELYRRFVGALGTGPFYNVSPLWSPSEVNYETTATSRLRAVTVTSDLSVFRNPLLPANADATPIEARDIWFRRLTARPQVQRQELPNAWLRVGQYDPGCLPSFDQLAGGGGIDAYSLPGVRLPNGELLGPTRAMSGYVNSPPLILTTLEGAKWLSDPRRFSGASGDAFISAIRVKVTGADVAGPVAYARLARAAAEIHDLTGLAVDIVVGSSPRPIQVDLPAGTFGRPDLVVSEGWSVKGIAYRFSRALQIQDVALFAVALLGALALVAQTAFVAVRRRRHEFAVLRGLGWQGRHLALLVLLEVIGIGLLSGLVALAIGFPLSLALGGGDSLQLILLVLPLAVLVSLVGGVLPAFAATRTSVAKALFTSAPIKRSRLPRRSWELGVDELVRRRGAEPLIGVTVIALAGTLLGTIVAIEIAFRGQLDVTVLGEYVAARIGPYHLVIALVTLAVGALAAGQIITLGYLERQPELAMLRAVGWRSRDVVAYVIGQALALCLIGGAVAALLVTILMLVLGANPRDLALGVLAGLSAPLLAVFLAIAATLAHAYRLSPAELLRGE